MNGRKHTLRDCARHAVQERIAAAAIAMFQTKGFHDTTVAEISSAVGMSTRTFFRYFSSKDDILLQPVQQFRQRFLLKLEPALQRENLWSALGLALEDALVECRESAQSAHNSKTQSLINDTPELLARQLQSMEMLQVEVADLLKGLPSSELDLDWDDVHAISGAAFSCLHAAQLRFSNKENVKHVIQNMRKLMYNLTPRVFL